MSVCAPGPPGAPFRGPGTAPRYLNRVRENVRARELASPRASLQRSICVSHRFATHTDFAPHGSAPHG